MIYRSKNIYLDDEIAVSTFFANCFSDFRLTDFDVWVSNEAPPLPATIDKRYRKCHHRAGMVGPGVTDQVNCDHIVSGRYVYVSLPGNGVLLTICELEVFGKASLISSIIDVLHCT